jgi:hypothetical protein
MNPQQPYVPPSPGNPYDFIMNPAPAPKRTRLPFGQNKFLGKIILVLGGLFVLLIIAVIVASVLQGNKTSTTDLVSLAQTQQEIIRISTLGTSDAVSQTTRNLAVTTQYTVLTQQQQVLAHLTKLGHKVGQKELTLKQDATTDQKFTAAKANSTYDQTYTEVMQQELSSYSTMVQNLIVKTPAGAQREVYSDYNQQTQLLIAEIPYAQKSLLANN